MPAETSVFEAARLRLEALPKKLSFKIGEAAELLESPPHVLRYWEKSFSLLEPKKMEGGQRLYSKRDMEILFLIKTLLSEESLSVRGVQKHLPSYYRSFKRQKLKIKKSGGEKARRAAKKKLAGLIKSISEIKSLVKNDRLL